MAQSFFKIDGRQVFQKDWGDYGDILQHGMSMHLSRKDGKISLERTGPYIPPITFPMEIVLTSEARRLLESSGLSGFSFQPVEKAHIVELRWETWDLNLDDPPVFPESGEPEDYILAEPHSERASEALGELWELVASTNGKIANTRSLSGRSRMRPYTTFDSSEWDGADLFNREGTLSILCSERARDWISEHWGAFAQFDPFPSK
jgi:hypothetical protein